MSDHLINDKYPWLLRLAYAYVQLSESLNYSTPDPHSFIPVVNDKLGYDFTASLQTKSSADVSFILETGLTSIIRNHHALNSMLFNDMILRMRYDKPEKDPDPEMFDIAMRIFKEAKMRYLVEEDKHVRFDISGLRLTADSLRKLMFTGVKVDSRQLYEALIYNPSQLSVMTSYLSKKPASCRYKCMVEAIDEARMFLELGVYLYMLARGIELDGLRNHYFEIASTYSHNVVFTPAVSSLSIAAACLPLYETSMFMERHARIFNKQTITIPEVSSVNPAAMRYINVFYGHTE